MTDQIAACIGYLVMVAAGAIATWAGLAVALEKGMALWRRGYNDAILIQAARAWRKANPEKFAKLRRMNGDDDC